MNKNRFFFIDLFKLVFSVFVVCIHSTIFSNQNDIASWYFLKGLFRLAVPFFFVCSGLFIGIKYYNSKDITIINKYIKRLIIPFIFWLCMNLPFQVFQYREYGLLGIIIRIIRAIVFYPWGALWYISATIVALLVIKLFIKKDKMFLCFIIGCILYLFALLCNNYYFLIEGTVFQNIIDLYMKFCVSARNGIFEGLMFISAGVLIGKRLIEKEEINYKKLLIVTIVSYVLLVVEIFLIKGRNFIDDGSLYICLIAFIPSFVMYLTKYKNKVDFSKFAMYSTGIYFSHRFVLACYQVLYKIIGYEYNSITLFIPVIITCIVGLAVLYKIDNKWINKVIK